jgi:hypothetical protein
VLIVLQGLSAKEVIIFKFFLKIFALRFWRKIYFFLNVLSNYQFLIWSKNCDQTKNIFLLTRKIFFNFYKIIFIFLNRTIFRVWTSHSCSSFSATVHYSSPAVFSRCRRLPVVAHPTLIFDTSQTLKNIFS